MDRSGKCIPFWSQKLGRSFRQACHPESASRSERQIRDAVSTPNKKAPARDKVEAKGTAYAVGVKRKQPISNGRPRSTLPAATGAAVGRIHHGQIRAQLAVKRAVGVLYGGRRGDRCDLANALAAALLLESSHAPPRHA